MQKKIDQLREFMLANKWDAALSLAAKFADLGDFKADIVRGHEAVTQPDFYKQLGQDPERMKNRGIAALMMRYRRFYAK